VSRRRQKPASAAPSPHSTRVTTRRRRLRCRATQEGAYRDRFAPPSRFRESPGSLLFTVAPACTPSCLRSAFGQTGARALSLRSHRSHLRCEEEGVGKREHDWPRARSRTFLGASAGAAHCWGAAPPPTAWTGSTSGRTLAGVPG
jgi:hypothetical protein